jgi:glutamate racemase
LKTIAVFDSGVGGLSVLRALYRHIPEVHWIYAADSAFAPYGERTESEVRARSLQVAQWLQRQHEPDVLVVACNTATAWAIDSLREKLPVLPIVGVEPALKPAALLSRTAHVGVLATSGTLSSPRFAGLLGTVQAQAAAVRFSCQPCPGLADAIERAHDSAIRDLCNTYAQALLARGIAERPLDTVVLGCTHYPFAMRHWQEAFGPHVAILDNAPAIARRTADLLGGVALPDQTDTLNAPEASLYASGDVPMLRQACNRWVPDLNVRSASRLNLP